MVEQRSYSQEGTEARRIHGRISRPLDDVNGFKVLPERVRRIRQTSEPEGIGHKQPTEFVMYTWRLNRYRRKKRHSDHSGAQHANPNGTGSILRVIAKTICGAGEPSRWDKPLVCRNQQADE